MVEKRVGIDGKSDPLSGGRAARSQQFSVEGLQSVAGPATIARGAKKAPID